MIRTTGYRREVLLVVVIVILAATYSRYSWIPQDPQAAVALASDTFGLELGETSRWFSAWSLGDGQAFAVIASDPFGFEQGQILGLPAYRYGRAGFGWAVWAASLGQPSLVPIGLGIVGALSVAGLVVLASRLRPTLGPMAWLLVLNPTVFIAFAGDTAESLGLLLLAWAISSAGLVGAALLGVTRPSYLVGLVGRWQPFIWGASVAAAFGVFWLARFGFDPGQYSNALALPLVGYLEAATFSAGILAVSATVTLVVGFRARDLSWIASGLFVLCFSAEVVELGVNGWRAAGMLFVLWAFGPGYRARRSANSPGWFRTLWPSWRCGY